MTAPDASELVETLWGDQGLFDQLSNAAKAAVEAAYQAGLASGWDDGYSSGVADTYQAIDYDDPSLGPARVNPHRRP